MKIIYAYPPNYENIANVFKISDRPTVVFTYGDTLYVPGGQRILIDKPLLRHEETHARQQKKMGVEKWWAQFLVDPEFRLSQELEAYREQYRAMAGLPLGERLGYLNHIAGDLAGEIYGNMMTPDEAKAVITKNIILKHVQPANGNELVRKAKKRARQNRKKGRR